MTPRTQRSTRPRRFGATTVLATSLLAAGSLAAATASATTTPTSGSETTAAAETTASAGTTAETTGVATAATTEATTAMSDPGTASTAAAGTTPEPTMGGTLRVAGEAEVGNPWTPANSQCDQYCQTRARTFYDPLVAVDQNKEWIPFLAESVTPNDDFTQWTIKLRAGITFTDGTPLNADAVIDNFNRALKSPLLAGALKDVAKDADGNAVVDKVDDLTLTYHMGLNGDVNSPMPWPGFPLILAGQAGFMASPTWLAAVDAGTADAKAPIGTGPFTVQEYLPGDRMTVVKNPNYWRTDAAGRQLPYLDAIEFRVIPDSQVREAALTSGDVDLITTSDANVIVDLLDKPDFQLVQQQEFVETNYVMLHLTVPVLQSKEVRCALQQAIDQEALINETQSGYPLPANGPFSPGQDGYLEDTGLPTYDPAAATAAIEAYEAENGPVTIRYATTPTGTTRATADFIQQAWQAIGVEAQVDTIEQSVLITNAVLGSPDFNAFFWRNHGGTSTDTQFHWWSSVASGPHGEPAVDGAFSLNFGRLADPAIDEALQLLRQEADPAKRAELAQSINRQMAAECYLLPMYWTTWATAMAPNVVGLGQDPTPDGSGTLTDGTGFGGQVWLTAISLQG